MGVTISEEDDDINIEHSDDGGSINYVESKLFKVSSVKPEET